MASPSFCAYFFIFFLHFHLTSSQAAGEAGKLIFEDGYTVSTVLDGDKSDLKVNPHSIIHQSPPSDLFVLLDSVASTFYTVSLPTSSNESVIKRLAGNGEPGYLDGDLDSAMFNKPRSFAVDFSGNVYVADQRKHSIRKISKTGVSTIAGGSSQKAGRKDGPGRDASFSDDFELTFIPQRCALMVCDHGNRLIRQINLKEADCTRRSGSVLGTTSIWLLGLGLSCLFGLIVGFVIRPYVLSHEGLRPLWPNWTWTCCLTSLERQIVMLCSDIRSVIVKSTIYSLSRQIVILSISQLSLMFRPGMVRSRVTCEKTVSLLDLDELCSSNSGSALGSSSSSSSSNNIVVSPKVTEELKDLLTFDGGSMLPMNAYGIVEQGKEKDVDVFSVGHNKIDGMIMSNLMNFEDQDLKVGSFESVDCNFGGLVKRR
ncbi:hypothetical protein CASFOL_024028 [Castilleja foliolosa]|uniref:NHL repeat-containing protein n=1 Tax=Castilleja foliolosa TaxID=1961234 RepID=A0ABD3CP89_9LAMI